MNDLKIKKICIVIIALRHMEINTIALDEQYLEARRFVVVHGTYSSVISGANIFLKQKKKQVNAWGKRI